MLDRFLPTVLHVAVQKASIFCDPLSSENRSENGLGTGISIESDPNHNVVNFELEPLSVLAPNVAACPDINQVRVRLLQVALDIGMELSRGGFVKLKFSSHLEASDNVQIDDTIILICQPVSNRLYTKALLNILARGVRVKVSGQDRLTRHGIFQLLGAANIGRCAGGKADSTHPSLDIGVAYSDQCVLEVRLEHWSIYQMTGDLDVRLAPVERYKSLDIADDGAQSKRPAFSGEIEAGYDVISQGFVS